MVTKAPVPHPHLSFNVTIGHIVAPEAGHADYRELSAPGMLVKTLYLLTGLEHQAVIVFFVLSGFLDGGQY